MLAISGILMTGKLFLNSFPGLMALIVDSGVRSLLLLMSLQPIGQMRLTGGSLLYI